MQHLPLILRSAVTLIFLCLLLMSGRMSMGIVEVEGRHRGWKWSYYISLICLLIGGITLVVMLDLRGRWMLGVIYVVLIVLGLVYYRTRWRGYLFQPLFQMILMGLLGGGLLAGVTKFGLPQVADSSYVVESDAMRGAYDEGDRVIVAYQEDIDRNDVLLFKKTGQSPSVLRVVGVPGEIITRKEGETLRCITDPKGCEPLDESEYLSPYAQSTPVCDKKAFLVDDGYLMLGDRRGNLEDSRCCFRGMCNEGDEYLVTKDEIRGTVVFVLPTLLERMMRPFFDFFGF